jgi:cellobiose phosphorylase
MGQCIGQPAFWNGHFRKRPILYLDRNAHELRLTPWQNDPVSDKAGEAYYLRDEESGRFWSPMPLPQRGNRPIYKTWFWLQHF